MPDLHQLLTEAVPPIEPGFSEADVRARLQRVERRHRRVVSAVAVLAGVLLIGVVATGIRVDQPAALGDDAAPSSVWPESVDFLGVEIAVGVLEAPTEPLEHRVVMGSGTAALTTQPSDALEPGNTTWQRVQHRLWFSCGGGWVVRMVEVGRAEGVPEFTVAGPGRWLPAGALIEAGRRLAESMGCEPAAPPGAPDAVEEAQPWVGELAAAMEEAGLATCCANPSPGPANGWYLNDWGVLLGGDDRLSLAVARSGREPFAGDQPVEVIDMAGGEALAWTDPSNHADVVEVVCGDAHILAHPTSGGAASVERFLQRIGCTPEIPSGAGTGGETAEPADALTPEAAAFIDRIGAAGLAVSDVNSTSDATTFHVRPTARNASPVWVSVDTEPRWDVDASTRLIAVAEGEAAEIEGGLLGMTCDGLPVRTTSPGAGGSEIAWIAEVLAATRCVPAPPGMTIALTQPDGTTVEVPASIREARLFDALDALGLQRCCSEPSHGRASASTGVVWQGAEVRIDAGPPAHAEDWLPAARVVDFADGQADLGDGDGTPTITFICGDTLYSLTNDSAGDPHIATAEALVATLGCTPTVTW